VSDGLRRIHIIFVVLTSLWAAGFLIASAAGFYDVWQDYVSEEDWLKWQAMPVKPVAPPAGAPWEGDAVVKPQAGPWEKYQSTASPSAEPAAGEIFFDQFDSEPTSAAADSAMTTTAGRGGSMLFEALAPDGRRYRITGPPDATPEQARLHLLDQIGPPAPRSILLSEPFFLAVAAFVPAALYWTLAWVIAGFLRDRRAKHQDK
jgi:hypothetical protein